MGKPVELKDIACTIIGITRPGFHGLRTGGTAAKTVFLPNGTHT